MPNPLIDFVERLRASAPAYDWQPTIEPPTHYERRLRPCAAPELIPAAGSVEEARRLIRESVWEYLALDGPAEILLIKALPGVGKTTAAVEVVDALAAAGKRIAYAGPRHDLYRDVVAKSGNPAQWYEWLPRQAEDPQTGKVQTCNWTEQINEWLNKGYLAMDFCAGVCGWTYVNERCPYHLQKGRQERVIYAQHQHVTLGHPLRFDVLFGDESPLGAFTREWRIPARHVLPPGMDPGEPLTEVLSYLASAAGQTERSLEGPQLLELLGGARAVREACEAFEMPAGAIDAASSIHRPEEAAEKPYFHLFELAPLLLREAKLAERELKYPHRIIVSQGFLTLLLRRRPDWEKLPGHVVWLDATGKPEIYKALFGRPVTVVDARPKLQGKIYQVVDRANGKTALLGKEGAPTGKATQAKQLVEAVVKTEGYARPSVITFKGLVETFSEKTGHFYAARGTNDHEEADAVFILGAPQPAVFDVVRLAKMIFFERERAFQVEWCTQERPYAYIGEDGQGRCYPVSGFWRDGDLQAVLEALREDEILQAAHRGRPVNHPVDIWLLTNVPLDGLAPDALLTMREVLGAPEGVNVFKWEQVQRVAEEKGEIFISDLLALGLSEHTAKSYLDKFIRLGWEPGARPTGKRGRPERFVKRQD